MTARPTTEQLAAVIADKLVHADRDALGTVLSVSSGMVAAEVSSEQLHVAVFQARAHAMLAPMIGPR